MSLGPAEILVILVVALLVLGPAKLPEAARQVGKAMAEFRRVTSGFQAEVRDAFQEPAPASPPAPAEFSVEPVHVPPPLPPADAVPPAFIPAQPAAPVPEAPPTAAVPEVQAVAPDAPPPMAPSPASTPAPPPQLPPDPPAH